jgi:hypothetical protein
MSVKIVRPKGKGGVVGDSRIPISTPQDLFNIRLNLAGHYKVVNDIDMIGFAFDTIIDDDYNSFTGTLDGQHFVIDNLKISRIGGYDTALFAYTDAQANGDNCVIKNLILTNINFEGMSYVGGLSTSSRFTDFENCYIDGTLIASGNNAGGLMVSSLSNNVKNCHTDIDINCGNSTGGGLIANMRKTNIKNSSSSGFIKGTSAVGGFIGSATSNGLGTITSFIENCNSSVEVEGSSVIGGLIGTASEVSIIKSFSTGKVKGGSGTGGLIGTFADYSKLEKCYSLSDVKGTDVVGGLIGTCEFDSEIIDSYSMGKVEGENSVGGLVGETLGNSIITNSFSKGLVTGLTLLGGLIGNKYAVALTSSYYDSQTSGQSDTGKGTAKTTAEMNTQSTFIGWDFLEKWKMVVGSYPRHK